MFPAALTIRDLVIRPATVLAPMAGVTDTVFRRVIRGLGGCGLIMTEFTSAEGVTRNAARTLHYLFRTRRTAHHRATVRRQPRSNGLSRFAGRGAGFRHRVHQPGLPGKKGGEVR